MMTKIPTILVVDDEKDFCHFARFNLEISGRYKVHTANTGQRALELAVKITPDLILLDIMMPGIDGWETLSRLKRDSVTSGIPVVIFTAREHTRGHQKSSDLGAADYFRKPFEPDELIDLVEKHIGQRD